LIEYILTGLYVLSCLVLILFVLLQPGKADAAAIFGGGATSTAFGPRGTQTILAKITIGAAAVFFLTAFLFSMPGLFGKKSVTRGLGPSQQQTAPVQTPPPPASEESPKKK
jgi:preprotein translocase subunit SecG